ncbi:MAG: calcium/proton exchanger [Chloroflexota bacterium]
MNDAFTWLLLLIPISVGLAYVTTPDSLWTFAAAAAGVIPLAEWMRRATEHLARRAGPAIGGLLNVSFGNTAELVLALFVLAAGKPDVVKAQLTGSIIGNSLLGLGLAILVGSIGRDKQVFKRARAGQLSSLLVLSMIALLLPALFDYVVSTRAVDGRHLLDEHLSFSVSLVLVFVYFANLVYTLVTHRDVFAFAHPARDVSADTQTDAPWPVSGAIAVLAAATAATALEAHYVSGALTSTASTLGLSEFFLGVIVLAVVGNTAEYVSAVYFARQDQMGLAISITVGSTIQIALLVAPLLVIVSAFSGQPMNLVFSSPLELIAIAAVTFAVNSVVQDGETTWFEGVLLLSIYALLALAFYFV